VTKMPKFRRQFRYHRLHVDLTRSPARRRLRDQRRQAASTRLPSDRSDESRDPAPRYDFWVGSNRPIGPKIFYSEDAGIVVVASHPRPPFRFFTTPRASRWLGGANALNNPSRSTHTAFRGISRRLIRGFLLALLVNPTMPNSATAGRSIPRPWSCLLLAGAARSGLLALLPASPATRRLPAPGITFVPSAALATADLVVSRTSKHRRSEAFREPACLRRSESDSLDHAVGGEPRTAGVRVRQYVTRAICWHYLNAGENRWLSLGRTGKSKRPHGDAAAIKSDVTISHTVLLVNVATLY
jgi:hypothetical protein